MAQDWREHLEREISQIIWDQQPLRVQERICKDLTKPDLVPNIFAKNFVSLLGYRLGHFVASADERLGKFGFSHLSSVFVELATCLDCSYNPNTSIHG